VVFLPSPEEIVINGDGSMKNFALQSVELRLRHAVVRVQIQEDFLLVVIPANRVWDLGQVSVLLRAMRWQWARDTHLLVLLHRWLSVQTKRVFTQTSFQVLDCPLHFACVGDHCPQVVENTTWFQLGDDCIDFKCTDKWTYDAVESFAKKEFVRLQGFALFIYLK